MDTARPSQGPLLPITCAFVASARVCRLPACHSTHSSTWSAFTTATSLPLQVELVGSPGTMYITLLLSSTQLWQIQGVVPLLGATHIMQLQAEPAATAAAIIIASLIVGTTIPCCTIVSLPLLPPSHMQEDPLRPTWVRYLVGDILLAPVLFIDSDSDYHCTGGRKTGFQWLDLL